MGVCERSTREPNFAAPLAKLHILGLKTDIVSHIYPIRASELNLVLAIHQSHDLSDATVLIEHEDTTDFVQLNLAFDRMAQPKVSDDQCFTQPAPWALVVLPFGDTNLPISKPGLYRVLMVQKGNRSLIGTLSFHHVPAPKLTEDQITALKSEPNAVRQARVDIGCRYCSDKLEAYVAFDRIPETEEAGVTWYLDLPDEFTCRCGKSKTALPMLRDNLHVLLTLTGHRAQENVSFTHLYELGSLVATYNRFEELLNTDPDEGLVQEFLESNPILFHFSSPLRIIKKGPVLTKYKTDFVIHSKGGQLLLVEIESPKRRLLKVDDGQRADLTHAFDQARDWLQVFRENRDACIRMLGIPLESVSKIRGLVVMGRDKRERGDRLRQLKSSEFGDVSLMTYDDLLGGFGSLVAHMKDL